MNKSNLIKAVADNTGVSKSEAAKVVDAVFEEITAAVARGESLKIRGFGTFAAVRRRSRKGYNIHSRKVVKLPEKNVPKFSPGKFLTEAAQTAAVDTYEDGKQITSATPAATATAAAVSPAPVPAPAAPAPPPVVTDPPATTEVDFSVDPSHRKAQRIARAYVSDLKAYYKDKISKVPDGDFYKIFEREIKDMRANYNRRIAEDVRRQKDYLQQELEELRKELS